VSGHVPSADGDERPEGAQATPIAEFEALADLVEMRGFERGDVSFVLH
jgi:hypothetical protein